MDSPSSQILYRTPENEIRQKQNIKDQIEVEEDQAGETDSRVKGECEGIHGRQLTLVGPLLLHP